MSNLDLYMDGGDLFHLHQRIRNCRFLVDFIVWNREQTFVPIPFFCARFLQFLFSLESSLWMKQWKWLYGFKAFERSQFAAIFVSRNFITYFTSTPFFIFKIFGIYFFKEKNSLGLLNFLYYHSKNRCHLHKFHSKRDREELTRESL